MTAKTKITESEGSHSSGLPAAMSMNTLRAKPHIETIGALARAMHKDNQRHKGNQATVEMIV